MHSLIDFITVRRVFTARCEKNIQLQFKVTYLNLGHAMVQTVSLWPLAAEARARSQASPCGISDGQSGTGTDSSPSASILPYQFCSINVPISFSATCCSYHTYRRRKPGNIPKSNALSKIGGGGGGGKQKKPHR
jgi:hypothetical protein